MVVWPEFSCWKIHNDLRGLFGIMCASRVQELRGSGNSWTLRVHELRGSGVEGVGGPSSPRLRSAPTLSALFPDGGNRY